MLNNEVNFVTAHHACNGRLCLELSSYDIKLFCTTSDFIFYPKKWSLGPHREIQVSSIPASVCFMARENICALARDRMKIPLYTRMQSFVSCAHRTTSAGCLPLNRIDGCLDASSRTVLPWRCGPARLQHTLYSLSKIMEHRLYSFLSPAKKR